MAIVIVIFFMHFPFAIPVFQRSKEKHCSSFLYLYLSFATLFIGLLNLPLSHLPLLSYRAFLFHCIYGFILYPGLNCLFLVCPVLLTLACDSQRAVGMLLFSAFTFLGNICFFKYSEQIIMTAELRLDHSQPIPLCIIYTE